MTVFVLGAGAVGSLIGGLLAAGGHRVGGRRIGGHRVVLIGREKVLQPVETGGLEVRIGERAFTVRPGTAFSLAEALKSHGAPDLIVCAVKSYDTAVAAAEIASVSPGSPGRAAGACVLTVQNGLGNEEELAARVGNERVLSGALTLAVSTSRPGRVEAEPGKGGLALAALAPGAAAAQRASDDLAATLAASGVPVRVHADYRAVKWSKLLLNILANASCAALDMTPAAALTDRGVFLIEREGFREACAVMDALGVRCINLPGYPVRLLRFLLLHLPPPVSHRLLLRRIAGGRGGKPPSLLLDLRRGRRLTEVGFLNGAIAAAGTGCGVRAPVNAALSAAVAGIAAGEIKWDSLRGNPRALAEFVRLL